MLDDISLKRISDDNLENRLKYWEVMKKYYRSNKDSFVEYCSIKELNLENVLFCIK